MRGSGLLAILAILLIGLVRPAEAHLLGSSDAGLAGGLLHPLTGIDHLLATLAAGAWATQMGGRPRWLLPVTFAVMLVIGYAIGMGGMPTAIVESGIALSVVLLGGFILVGLRPGVGFGAALMATFASLHGYVHGGELPTTAASMPYAIGLVAATALLLCLGIAAGLLLPRLHGPVALRSAGAAVAGIGSLILLTL